MSEPKYDPEGALQYARTHPREKGVPPHYVRCDWMYNGKRCRLGDGHPTEHEFEAKK
jgi:hypothetical protein